MSEDEPPTLDYANPELPRPGQPPDGYLGYRSAEPPPEPDELPDTGVRLNPATRVIVNLGVGLFAIVLVLGCLYVLIASLCGRSGL